MESLKELTSLRNSLERQIDNSRNEQPDLIDELEEVEQKIAYIVDNTNYEREVTY